MGALPDFEAGVVTSGIGDSECCRSEGGVEKGTAWASGGGVSTTGSKREKFAFMVKIISLI
jgi:hypothetical protein